ncbi:MAG TPA: hypothetical protein VF770_02325 [Solirubrobacterales bacterium]
MDPGGKRRNRRRPRLRAAVAAAAVAALATAVAACGSEPSSDLGEVAGAYRLQVASAAFPTAQRLGQTSMLQIGVRNTGHKTAPALTVTISIAGTEGQTSSLPFGIHDPQPGLAQPDRPVWVLAAHYPKLAGSRISAGAETSSRKTFDFGPLKPGATTEAVWKLSAVKAGKFTLLFKVDAGLGGAARATTAGGIEPGGSFAVRISPAPPNTIVTDSGRVVTIPRGRGR